MKKRRPLTQKKFRADQGQRCPHCHKLKPTMRCLAPPQAVIPPTLGHALGFVRVLCGTCGASWLVEFRPYKYSGLRPERVEEKV